MAVNQDYTALRERYQQRQAERQNARTSHTEALKSAFLQRQAQRGFTNGTSPQSGAFDIDPRKMGFLQRQMQRGNITQEQVLEQIYKPYKDFINQVNGVISGYEQFANNYNTRFGGRKYDMSDAYMGDSQQYLDEATAYNQQLIAQSNAILATLEANPDAFDKETVEAIKSSLTMAQENAAAILKVAGEDNAYWNSWGSNEQQTLLDILNDPNQTGSKLNPFYNDAPKTGEEAYKRAQQDQSYAQKYAGKTGTELVNLINLIDDEDEREWVTGEAMRTMSFDEAQKDLETMKQEYLELSQTGTLRNHATAGMTMSKEEEAAAEAAVAQYEAVMKKYGIDTSDEDINPMEELDKLINSRAQLIAESRRMQEHIRLSSVKKNDDFEHYSKLGEEEASEYAEKNKKTDHMTASEIGVLAYYIAKDKENGTNLAEQYKDSLKFYLKHRRAEEIADWINDIDIPVIEGLTRISYAATAKTMNWGQDVLQNFFSNRKLNPTVFQMADDYIGQDLKGVDRILHQTAGTVGYMAPSILASKFIGGATGVSSLGKAAGSALMFLGSSGQAYGQAIEKGYDKPKARAYATLVGLSEVRLQNILGGISEFGGLPAKLDGKIGNIKNALLKGVAKYGASAFGEVAEEELQNVLEPAFRTIIFGEKYDKPTAQEIIDTALVSALTTGGMEGPGIVKDTIKDAKTQKLVGDQITQHSFLTNRERVVVNTITQKLVAEAEQSGKKLSQKEKQAIYDQVVEDMDTGRIDIKDIENSIGKGTEYETLVSERDELKKLNSMKHMEMTGEQSDRLAELKAKNQEYSYDKAIQDYDAAFSQAVEDLVKTDRLAESYRERDRRSEAYQVEDLNQYSEAQRKTIQSAMDSGILNNTRRTHEFVDFIAKVSEKLGVNFTFTDNQRLKESGFALKGVTVNGYVNKDGITINVNSAKALNRVVGHEITHILEGTDFYNDLAAAITTYARTKGEYESRLEQLRELYKDKEGYTGKDAEAKIEAELVADLVGDYIFTDKAFVEKLFQEEPGLFKRIFEEIKYLCKLVTAGSKEARQLEKAKKMFTEVVREASENGVKNPTGEGGLKYDLSDGTTKDASQLSRTDLRYLLENAQNGEYSDKSYIPLRRNTPKFFIDVVKEHSKGSVAIEDYPMAITARHIRQNMEEEDGQSYGSERPHGLSVEDIITISEKMGDPSYIVLQENGRYAEVVSFYNKNNKHVVVAIDFAEDSPVKPKNYKYSQYMNGYSEGFYNIIVTQYEPNNLKNYLEDCEIIYSKKEMNGKYQVGSGRVMAVTHDTPFIEDIVTEKQPDVNSRNSLSAPGQGEAAGGGWDVRGQDVGLPMPEGYQESPVAVAESQQAQPVNLPGLEKSQPQSQGKAQEAGIPMPKQSQGKEQKVNLPGLENRDEKSTKATTKATLPMPERTVQQEQQDLDAEYRRQMGDDSSYYDPAEGEEIETARERLEVQRSNLQIELRENQRLRQEMIEDFDQKIEAKQTQYDGKKLKHSKTAQALLRDIEKLKRKKADRMAEYDQAIARNQSRIGILDEKLATNKPEKQDRLEKAYERIDKDRDAAELDLIKLYDAKKAEISKGLDNKEQWIKNKAFDVLWEMGNWVKGSQPSRILGRIWDLRVDGHRLEWDDIKHALADIKDGYTVLPNQAEKAIREVLERTYQDRVTELSALEESFNRDVEKLNKDAEKAKEEARKNESNLLRSELHEQLVGTVRQAFTDNKLDMDRVLADAKDLATIKTVDNTPQRVLEKALGRKAGQVLSDLTFNKVAQNETDGIRWLNSYTNRKDGVLKQLSEKYNIKPGSKESAAAQMYAEGFYVNEANEIVGYGDRELAADFPDVKTQANIKGLAKDPTIRKIYDETLDLINASRVRNAYPEIQKLANYYLHFRAMGDTFSQLGLPFNPNDIRAKDLPTDLNGVTADLKPGQPYFASAQHREGKRTSFDLLGGLEMYLTSAKNQIFHIDDIQILRALRNYVANVYGRANGLDNLDELTDEQQEAKIKEVYNSHLSTFAKFLNESANVLAGKTLLIDRGLEGIFGRRAITMLNDINKQVGANMVGYNLGSPLTNFLAVMETLAKAEGFKGDFIKAAGQMAMNTFRRQSDGFAEKSSVIVRRKGAEQFNRTLWQKLGDPGYWLMSKTDEISTELIARTKYNELIRKGMDEKTAHYETDKWVSRLMGDRSLGQMPLIFNSKTLGMFTKFQLEVRNKLDSAFYDTIQEAKEIPQDVKNRNAKVAAKITSKMVQSAILDHVFGMAFQKIAGYNPAFDIISIIATAFGWNDDEDDDDTFLDNLEQAFFELLEDLPYTSTLTGGRIAIGNALPIKQLITGKDQYGNEKKRWKTLLGALPYYVLPGGYGQAKKTVQGLNMYGAFDWLTGQDHSVSGNYTDDGRLRYTVSDNPASVLQKLLFGKWAGQNPQQYIEEGRSPLSQKQTQEFFDLDVSIEEYWDIQDGLKQLNKESDSGKASINDIGDYIGELDLTTEQKNILINNAAGRKEPIDMATYDEYPNFEEFDYGTQNPGKYAVSQAVGGFEAFKEYQEDLKDLDKNEAADYINDLDIDYGMKIILYVSRYSSKASREEYGYDIVEYLNGRRDIDENQMRKILRELGFKVDWQGNVTWD